MAEWLRETFSNPYVIIVLWTLIPALELRASIPYGIMFAHLPWYQVVPVAVVANFILGPVLFLLLEKFMHLLLRWGPARRQWDRMILKTQKKIHPLVEKYGIWGLGLFIGVPLPGSGVYTGAVGAYLLGFTKLEFYVATAMGVLIAAAAVTAVVMTGSGALSLFIKAPVGG